MGAGQQRICAFNPSTSSTRFFVNASLRKNTFNCVERSRPIKRPFLRRRRPAIAHRSCIGPDVPVPLPLSPAAPLQTHKDVQWVCAYARTLAGWMPKQVIWNQWGGGGGRGGAWRISKGRGPYGVGLSGVRCCCAMFNAVVSITEWVNWLFDQGNNCIKQRTTDNSHLTSMRLFAWSASATRRSAASCLRKFCAWLPGSSFV